MKKAKFMAFLLFAGFAFAACESDDDEFHPTLDDKNTVTVTFEGSYWDALIDNAQYGGSLIYSGDTYAWTDPQTSLSSEVVKADWSQWGMGYGWDHGIAISNYVNPDATSYMEQLSVGKSDGNFAVAFDNNSALTFADGKAREIVSIDLAPVAYAYNQMVGVADTGYEFDVILTFALEDGSNVSRTIALAKDSGVQKKFETYNFGIKATSVRLTFDGTDKSEWGLNTPKYVAIDNIVVK